MKDENQNFEDLEEQLAKLLPNGPEPSYLRALGRHLDSLEEERVEKVVVRNVVWTRFAPFAPLAAAACVALGVTLFVQNRGNEATPSFVESAVFPDEVTGFGLASIVPVSDLGDFTVSERVDLPQLRSDFRNDGGLIQVSGSAIKNVTVPPVSSWTVDVKSADQWEKEHKFVKKTHFIIPTEADELVPSFSVDR